MQSALIDHYLPQDRSKQRTKNRYRKRQGSGRFLQDVLWNEEHGQNERETIAQRRKVLKTERKTDWRMFYDIGDAGRGRKGQTFLTQQWEAGR